MSVQFRDFVSAISSQWVHHSTTIHIVTEKSGHFFCVDAPKRRFKGWTCGLSGVTGFAHTALIVIGFFSIFSGILPFSLDIDQTFIAAILTIIGYAINDTMVIFDRIREYKELHPKSDFKKNVNAAPNSTLSRTMNTSLTTLITMIAIAIFGGEVIRGLAVALIVGIVVGTYASIFIATPIMYDVTKKADAKKEDK